MIILIAAALLASVIILCGYTTIRMPPRSKSGKIHIACIGDSITYGCTLPLFFLQRYPAVLQRLLGADTQVAAFGINDRTLQNTGNKPFRKERAFRQNKTFQPDAVVILLGTNDSKERNWSSAETFLQQYAVLISEYRSLNSNPYILLCTPPCAFRPVNRFFSITNDAKQDRLPEIARLVETIAAESHSGLADLFKLTAGHREFFGPDGLHPNSAGSRAIAEEIYQCLQGTLLV